RTSQLFYDSPRGKQDRETHDKPEYETSRAHLKNNCAEATFHAYRWRFYMEETRDILRTKRLGAYTISVGPALITECSQKIDQRIIPTSALKRAVGAAGRKSLGIESDAREERLGKSKKQQSNTQGNTEGGALQGTENAHHLTLAPGSAPNEGHGENQHASGAPQQNASRSAQNDRARNDCQREEGQMPSFSVTQKKVAYETNDHQQGNQHEVAEAPGTDEHGGRTIGHQTGDRRNTIIRAQFANFLGRPLGIQKRVS